MAKAGVFRQPPAPQVPRKSVPEPPAAAFDPASGFPWTVDWSTPAAPSVVEVTVQSFAIGPPSAAFDPASGFPWPVEDRQDTLSVAQTFDPTAQAGSLWVADPPLSGFPWLSDIQQDRPLGQQTYAPEDPVTIGAPTTEQLAGIWQGPQPDIAPGQTFDDTASGWTSPTFDPRTGIPWTYHDAQQDRSTQPVWYDGTDGNLVLVQGGTAPFDPSTGFPWTFHDQQTDASTQPVWYDGIDGSWVAQFDPRTGIPLPIWDAQQDRSLQPVWYDPSEQSWAIVPIFDPAKTAGFISADHPIPAFVPGWHDETPQFPPFAVIPSVTTVTGGYGPSGTASSFGMGAGAIAPVPAGGSSASRPTGSATAPKPSR